MNDNRVNEIKKEDKKAFKGFAIVVIISAIIGGIVGAMSVQLKEILGSSIPSLLINVFEIITPYTSIVLSVIVYIVYKIIYTNSRKEYDLWVKRNEDDDIIDKIEEKLSYIMLFTSVNTIIGFFFLGIGSMLLTNGISIAEGIITLIGFIICVASSILIQKKVVNFEKEINPLLKGSVYDTKFSEKWLNSCDESIQLEIYKSSYQSYKAVSTTCIILWVFCMIGYDLWDFGIMPMVMVIIIWLVQTVSYCMASIKYSKAKK